MRKYAASALICSVLGDSPSDSKLAGVDWSRLAPFITECEDSAAAYCDNNFAFYHQAAEMITLCTLLSRILLE